MMDGRRCWWVGDGRVCALPADCGMTRAGRATSPASLRSRGITAVNRILQSQQTRPAGPCRRPCSRQSAGESSLSGQVPGSTGGGPSGIAPGTASARAWHATQSASQASHVMVSYLPASGSADVPVMLSTLVERRCGVIIVTGATWNEVAGAAAANPRQRFILVSTGAVAGAAGVPANAVAVSAASASGRINRVVRSLADTA